jgi:hypothetical protein
LVKRGRSLKRFSTAWTGSQGSGKAFSGPGAMAEKPERSTLIGRWVRSYEDEHGREEVYRRYLEGTPIAPSRKPRTQLHLEADGHGQRHSGIATDALDAKPIRWVVGGDGHLELRDPNGGVLLAYEVVETSGDVLRLRFVAQP